MADRSSWRRFELQEGKSSKFWAIRLEGRSYRVRFGRIGSEGREQEKAFPEADRALREYEKIVAEKLRKGYQEVGPAGAAPAEPRGKAAPKPTGAAPVEPAGKPKEPSALAKAVRGGKLDEVRRLLAGGADPNERAEGKSLLAHAEKVHRTAIGAAIAAALLDAGADPARAPGELNLVWAVTTRNLEIVRRYVDAGAEVDCSSMMGSPLQAAANLGELEMVRLLAAAGADLDTGTIVGNPLTRALERGHEEIVCELLTRGASPRPTALGVPSPAAKAAKEGMARALRALAEAGADLQARASFQEVDAEGLLASVLGQVEEAASAGGGVVQTSLSSHVTRTLSNATPLIAAAAEGHLDCLRVLLERGVDLEALDDAGHSAFEHARARGHAAICDALRAAGARETAQRPPPFALLLAAEAGDLPGVEAALTAGAPVDTRDARGAEKNRTPLMLAAARGHEAVVRRLLAAGAAPGARDDEGEAPGRGASLLDYRGRSALLAAAAGGHAVVIERLLAAGADREQRDQGGNTALILAAGAGHAEAVRTLCAAGADPDARGPERSTALHAALEDNHAEAALALIAAGADCQRKNGDGNTPLHTAALLEMTEVVEALLAAGADPTVPNREKETPRKQADGALAARLAAAERAWKKAGRPTTAVRDEEAEREAERKKKMAARTPPPGIPTLPELRKRYDRKRVLARLRGACEGANFQACLAELEGLCGAPRRDLREDAGGYGFHVASRLQKALDLEALQARFLERGTLVFCCSEGSGLRLPGQLLALPTCDRYDALAVMGTAGCGSVEGAIRWLMDRHATQPFTLTWVKHDTLRGRFLGPIADPEELAQSMYELCSDIVDQGTETVEALAEALAKEGRLFFWWD